MFFCLLVLGFKTCCDLTLFASFFNFVAILSDSKATFLMKRLVKQGMKRYMGIDKKPRPFNHIFGGDRILRA